MNARKAEKSRLVNTAKGQLLLEEKRDLCIGNLNVKGAWYNNDMTTTILSEGNPMGCGAQKKFLGGSRKYPEKSFLDGL